MNQNERIQSIITTCHLASCSRLSFVFHALPPSINNSYGISGKRLFLKREVEDFKHQIYYETRKYASQFKPKNPLISVLLFHSPDWITKNGGYKKKDLDNMLKSFNDALSVSFNYDDKLIFESHQFKVVSPTKFTEVHLFEMK